MAKYFIRMDTYWQNSPDRWFGPYPNRAAAEAAIEDSGASRADLGQSAQDVKNQTRVLGIHNATEARKLGHKASNTYPAMDTVPGDRFEIQEVQNALAY